MTGITDWDGCRDRDRKHRQALETNALGLRTAARTD